MYRNSRAGPFLENPRAFCPHGARGFSPSKTAIRKPDVLEIGVNEGCNAVWIAREIIALR